MQMSEKAKLEVPVVADLGEWKQVTVWQLWYSGRGVEAGRVWCADGVWKGVARKPDGTLVLDVAYGADATVVKKAIQGALEATIGARAVPWPWTGEVV